MNKRLILHVGYPKTGTTTLQRTLFPGLSLPATLYLGKLYGEKAKFREPEMDEWRYAINTRSSLHFDDFLIAHKGKIKKILSQCSSNCVIWSVEGFLDPTLSYSRAGYVPKDVVLRAEHLRKMVETEVPGSFETLVLITIRNQVELMGSTFCHTGGRGVRSGLHRHTFASFVRFCLDDMAVGFGPAYDYLRMSELYERLFDAGNVLVLPMEGLFDRNTGMYRKKLAAHLGASSEDLECLITATVEKKRRESALTIVIKRYPALAQKIVSGASMVSRYSGILSHGIRVVDVATTKEIIKERILDYYCSCNKELSKTYNLALEKYEYW